MMNEANSAIYTAFFNKIETLSFVLDLEGTFVEANASTCKIFCIDDKKIKATNINDLSVFSDKYIVLKKLQETNIDNKLVFEFYIKDINNQTTPYEIYAQKVQINSEYFIICNAHTIFNSKEVENRILSAVVETEENERSRFAKDLHDGLGPLLSTIKLYVHELNSDDNSKQEKKEYINYIIELLDEAVTNTREISNNLAPQIISTYGLVESIDSFKNKINATHKIDVMFTHNDIPDNLQKSIKLTLFRIVTELINNTMKHASATQINIDLFTKNDVLHLNYKDDGIGFNLNEAIEKGSSGIGLTNIINRIKSMSGNFYFNNKIEKGVEMQFSIKTIEENE